MDAPGPDGGPPPPPWKRDERRRDRVTIAAITAGALVLAVPIGLVAVSIATNLDDIDLSPTGGAEAPSATPDDGGGGDDAPPPDPGEVQVPTLDLDALDGRDLEHGQLFTDIDRAEQVMVATQLEIGTILGTAGPDGRDAALDEVSAAAGDGQRALQELRTELTVSLEDEDARSIRDDYLGHLDAWVRYLVAIERDAQVLGDDEAQEALLVAIDTTGDAFARSVREELPAGLAPEVREVADAILQRGFGEREPAAEDTV